MNHYIEYKPKDFEYMMKICEERKHTGLYKSLFLLGAMCGTAYIDIIYVMQKLSYESTILYGWNIMDFYHDVMKEIKNKKKENECKKYIYEIDIELFHNIKDKQEYTFMIVSGFTLVRNAVIPDLKVS